jgi:cytochrome P450
MSDGSVDLKEAARAKAYSIPLEDYHVADPALFQADAHWPYFERLRAEDPVHYCAQSEHGPYWSVTRYNDIMTVDTNHQVFSSDSSISAASRSATSTRTSSCRCSSPWIQPKHDIQRKTVSPIVSPVNLALLEGIDPRAGRRASSTTCRSARPFDWVDQGVDRADHADAGHPVRLSRGRNVAS